MNNTYLSLLNISFYKNKWILFLYISLIVLLILSFKISIYNTYKTYAISKDNLIIVSVPIYQNYSVKNGKYLKINNQNYLYEIIKINDIDNNFNQEYVIKTNYNLVEKEYLEITFFYNKEKVIKKIIDIIF